MGCTDCWRVAACLLALVTGCAARRVADDEFHFQQCSNAPIFNVSAVAISPNPAIHGQDILVTLSGSNTKEVTRASLTVTIYYRGWPVQRQTRDICNGDRPVQPGCPFEPGNLTIASSDSVPLLAPVGPYSMRMQAWDQDGAAVMCIDIWFRVVAAPSAAKGGGAPGGGAAGASPARGGALGGSSGGARRSALPGAARAAAAAAAAEGGGLGLSGSAAAAAWRLWDLGARLGGRRFVRPGGPLQLPGWAAPLL